MSSINPNKKIPLAVRVLLILVSSLLFAVNIKTFIHSAELFPGGFSGVAILIQNVGLKFFNKEIPYSLLTYAFNIVPVIIGFRFIGKKFTILSCILIVVSGLFTDLIPFIYVTDDMILCAVFGGVINSIAMYLCLLAESSSGGTDFIAIYIAETTGKSAWNIILAFNCLIICVAGILINWEAALYSIIFQYTSTEALNYLYKKYEKITLFIITDKPDEVYTVIKDLTNHDATVFTGTGKFSGSERKMLYSVVGSSESGYLEKEIRKADPDAFINVMKTKEILGKFYKRSSD